MKNSQVVLVFAVSGAVAGAFCFAFDNLARNPFFVGTAFQGTLLGVSLAVSMRLSRRPEHSVPAGRLLAAWLVLTASLILAEFVSGFWWYKPQDEWRLLSLLLGLLMGLGTALAARVLAGKWEAAPAILLIATSSPVVYAQLFGPANIPARLVVPLWILAVTTGTGWWVSRALPRQETGASPS